MAQPRKNPYVLPGALATFVMESGGEGTTAPPPPTITTTWATLAAALGVSAPLSYRSARAVLPAIKGARP